MKTRETQVLAGIRLATLAVVLLAPLGAQADRSLAIYWENDGTFLKPNGPTDRHYTNGTKIVYTHQPGYQWLKDLGRWNNFARPGEKTRTALGYFLAQNIYTPDEVATADTRNPYDRIFAGWLYTGIFAQRAGDDRLEHFELNLGMIGPSTRAGDTQNLVHDLVHTERAKGWNNQLGDEFAVDFSWQKKQLLGADSFRPTSNLDFILEYGFTAGSLHRHANIGLLARVGLNLPADFGPGRLEMPATFTPPTRDGSSAYLFGRAGTKLVQYNRFLTGLNTEVVVGQFQLGVAYRYKSFELSYSQTFFTREFKHQEHTDSFAALNLICRF